MAYVRKTEEMQDGVLRKIRDMKDKALSAYSSNNIERGTPEFDAAIEAAKTASFKDAPQLRQSYPDAWMTKIRYNLQLRFQRDDGIYTFTTSLDLEDMGVKLPAHVESNYSSMQVDVKRADCPPVLQTWLDTADQRNTQRQQIAEQYSNVETQLRHFMAGHASLNSMLKEMPEFEMYVPEKYMAKFHEATKPREKKPQQQSLVEELSIDRDAIAAIAIANRMTT
jgi:hypothetical protein